MLSVSIAKAQQCITIYQGGSGNCNTIATDSQSIYRDGDSIGISRGNKVYAPISAGGSGLKEYYFAENVDSTSDTSLTTLFSYNFLNALDANDRVEMEIVFDVDIENAIIDSTLYLRLSSNLFNYNSGAEFSLNYNSSYPAYIFKETHIKKYNITRDYIDCFRSSVRYANGSSTGLIMGFSSVNNNPSSLALATRGEVYAIDDAFGTTTYFNGRFKLVVKSVSIRVYEQ